MLTVDYYFIIKDYLGTGRDYASLLLLECASLELRTDYNYAIYLEIEVVKATKPRVVSERTRSCGLPRYYVLRLELRTVRNRLPDDFAVAIRS